MKSVQDSKAQLEGLDSEVEEQNFEEKFVQDSKVELEGLDSEVEKQNFEEKSEMEKKREVESPRFWTGFAAIVSDMAIVYGVCKVTASVDEASKAIVYGVCRVTTSVDAASKAFVEAAKSWKEEVYQGFSLTSRFSSLGCSQN